MITENNMTQIAENPEIEVLLGQASPLYLNLSVASLVEHAVRRGRRCLHPTGRWWCARGNIRGVPRVISLLWRALSIEGVD